MALLALLVARWLALSLHDAVGESGFFPKCALLAS